MKTDAKTTSSCANDKQDNDSRSVFLADIDFEDMELDAMGAGLSWAKTMVAGSSAGVMEHLCMFPVDTIKTRMQQLPAPGALVHRSVFHAMSSVVQREGVRALYRGVTATVLGAIPSHAIHFATYEACRKLFGADKSGHHPLLNGAAGGIAVMAHDAVSTPVDVIKQRLQMEGSRYYGIRHCARTIYTNEGLFAFYASYPTTLLLNIPFISVQYGAYESFKLLLSDKEGKNGAIEHAIGGGLAGALAGLVSTPIDVIKTRIQTQEVAPGCRRMGPKKIIRSILKEEGFQGLFRGAQARVLQFMPSAAICWTTYEAVKNLLRT